MEFCNRCGCPVEEPITYADEICGPYADTVEPSYNHAPVCVHCAEVRRHEVISRRS